MMAALSHLSRPFFRAVQLISDTFTGCKSYFTGFYCDLSFKSLILSLTILQWKSETLCPGVTSTVWLIAATKAVTMISALFYGSNISA